MSRIERLREYSRMAGPKGEASSKETLASWSDRASANSKIAPRASGGEMKLQSTGKAMADRSTGMKPYARRSGDAARAEAKADTNDVGSTFMRGIRRGV